MFIPDTSPHAEHSTRVVVSLEQRALAALQQDDGSVDNLVELGEVEPPSVPRQRLLPKPTIELKPGADTVRTSVGGSVQGVQNTTSLHTDAAERASERLHSAGAVNGAVKSADHTDKGPGRVDGEEDVVDNDEELEGAGLRDLVGGAVGAAVEKVGAHSVGGCDGEGHPDIEDRFVELGGDGEVRGNDDGYRSDGSAELVRRNDGEVDVRHCGRGEVVSAP